MKRNETFSERRYAHELTLWEGYYIRLINHLSRWASFSLTGFVFGWIRCTLHYKNNLRYSSSYFLLKFSINSWCELKPCIYWVCCCLFCLGCMLHLVSAVGLWQLPDLSCLSHRFPRPSLMLSHLGGECGTSGKFTRSLWDIESIKQNKHLSAWASALHQQGLFVVVCSLGCTLCTAVGFCSR